MLASAVQSLMQWDALDRVVICEQHPSKSTLTYRVPGEGTREMATSGPMAGSSQRRGREGLWI